ncbi:MAG: hypothetical protein WC501_01150 [Candidatus Micrarchaeia archaeon]
MKEITIYAPNTIGSLALLSETLGAVGVNIEAISAYEKNGKAIFKILTKDVTTALKAVSKLSDFQAQEEEIIIYRLNNRPGELGKLARKLSNADINLESLYIVGKNNDETEVAILPATQDFSKTKEILKIK